MPAPLDLILAGLADADLVAIFRWSSERFGAAVAADYLRGLDEAFGLLCRHPQAGRPHRLTAEPVRVLSQRSHRIFYDATETAVTILRVLHQAQSVERGIDG